MQEYIRGYNNEKTADISLFFRPGDQNICSSFIFQVRRILTEFFIGTFFHRRNTAHKQQKQGDVQGTNKGKKFFCCRKRQEYKDINTLPAKDLSKIIRMSGVFP